MRSLRISMIRIRPLTISLLVAWGLLPTLAPRGTAFGAEPTSKRPLAAALREINQEAREARGRGDLSALERLRNERWAAVEAEAEENPDSDDVWVVALKALTLVDGDPFIETADGGQLKPGLVNECRYREAWDTLLSVWTRAQSLPGGEAVPGEIATRLFEVLNQAKGILPGVSEPQSPSFIAGNAELLDILSTAERRDPCCVLAVPMREFVSKTDPREAFLRADVRPSFMKRQAELTKLTHPSVLVKSNGGNGGVETQDGDKPVAKWHAPVEIAKSQSLHFLLRDLDYATPLTPDILLLKAPTTNGQRTSVEPEIENYIVPGQILKCSDALSDPVQLLYGRMLLAQVLDKKSRRRPAFMFIDEKGVWQKRYLNILGRHPREGESVDSPAAVLLNSIPESMRFTLGPCNYSLYNYPVMKTEEFIRLETQILCVRDVFKFCETVHSPTRNPTKHLSIHRSRPVTERECPVVTTPATITNIALIEANSDATKHPINELLLKPGMNPLLLVSDDDGTPSEPNWLVDQQGTRYLLLEDGRKLRFVSAPDDPVNAYFEIGEDATFARFPLSLKAVPPAILAATPVGQLMRHLLENSGYRSNEEIFTEITAYLNARQLGKDYIPLKFEKQVAARAKSTGADKATAAYEMMAESIIERLPEPDRSKFKGELGQLQNPASRIPPLKMNMQLKPGKWETSGYAPEMGLYLPYASTIKWSRNFVKSQTPWPEGLFARYGFRYVLDPRGNIVTHRGLTSSTVGTEVQTAKYAFGAVQVDEAFDYPFDFRTPDGKLRIATSQIYGWQDYLQIKSNIFREHLAKAVALHPCFPALAWVKLDARYQIENPSARDPAYMKDLKAEKKDGQAPGGGGTTQDAPTAYPTFSQPCSLDDTGGDEDMQTSVNNLTQAYTDLWTTNASQTYSSEAAMRRRLLLQFLRDLGVSGQEDRTWFDTELKSLQEKIATKPKFTTLNAIQVQAARSLATSRYYHKSLVFYNDAISSLSVDVDRGTAFDIFQKVATSEEANAFIQRVEQLVEGQKQILTLELETAGVLMATKYTDSAYQVFKRISDEHRHYLKPSIQLATEYIGSYGLRLSDRIKEAVSSLEEVVQTAEKAIDRYALSVDWRASALAPGRDDTVARAQCQTIATLLAMESSTADEDRQRDSALAAVRNLAVSMPAWLAVKKSLVRQPQLALRGNYVIHPQQFCPTRYSAEQGFIRDPVTILSDTDEATVRQFCEAGPGRENPDQAGTVAYLLAWYWTDQGESAKARAAYMSAAEKFKAAAAAESNKTKSLTLEINAYQSLVGASSVMIYLPGLSQQKAEFSTGLKAQLLNWERRWFAEGLYGPHATSQVVLLQSHTDRLRNQIDRANADWRAERYYFPDYQFRFKALPDIVVLRLFETRRESLDKQLDVKDGDAAAEAAAAVERRKWVIDTKQKAHAFLEGFQQTKGFDEEIVFLSAGDTSQSKNPR